MANVETYTWSTCPFCRRAKHLLDQKGVTYTEYVLDGDEAARDAMVARGTQGRRSVPQIFINDQHIGGSDTLYDLEQQGKLDALLNSSVAQASRKLASSIKGHQQNRNDSGTFRSCSDGERWLAINKKDNAQPSMKIIPRVIWNIMLPSCYALDHCLKMI